MPSPKRNQLRSKKGGMKNVADMPLPPPKSRGILDNDPRPLHGLGDSAMADLERRVGITFEDFRAQYIESIGGPSAVVSMVTYKLKGDTPEEKIARLVADMMRFFAEFRATHDVVKSYNIDGLTRARVYEWKSNHKFVSDLWDSINEERFDRAERALYERSVEGVEEPIVGNGQIVGHRTKYSDDLLKFLLSGNRATIYRKAEEKVRQQLEVEMQVRGSLGIEGLDFKRLSDAELGQLQTLLDKAKNEQSPSN